MIDELDVVASHAAGDHRNWPITDVLAALDWDGERARRRGYNGWTHIRHCPFHGGDGGAAYNETLNSFRCFACDARGNSVTLVAQQKRLSPQDAVDWLNRNVTPHSSPTRRPEAPLPWELDWDGT